MSYIPSYQYPSLYKTNKFKANAFGGYNQLSSVSTNTNQLYHTSLYGNINQIKQQNSIASNRNNELLSKLHSNMLETYARNNLPNQFSSLLESSKYNMGTYLNENHPTAFQTDINYKLLTKQNELIAVKTVLESQIEQNQQLLQLENDYCSKMQKTNEELLKKIQELSDQNDKLTYDRQRIQKNYAVMEEQINFSLMSLMTRPKKEPKADIEFIPPKKEEIKVEEPIKEEEEESEDEEVKERIKRYKLIKEKIVTLNMNHAPGKLDEIRKKQLEEQLKKEQQEIEERLKSKKMKEKFTRPMILNSTMIIEKKEKEGDKQKDTIELNINDHIGGKTYTNTGDDTTIKQYTTSFKKMQTILPKKENIKEEQELEDLSSKKVSNKEKEKVLSITIKKIEDYMKECQQGTKIYKDYHSSTGELRHDIRKIYEELKNNTNVDVNIDILPMLIFEIVNSNYNLNLNPEKLKDKGEYDLGDFEIDLNEDYQVIVNDTIKHLRKVIINGYGDKQTISVFLAKALCNFEHDDMMIERLAGVLMEKFDTR